MGEWRRIFRTIRFAGEGLGEAYRREANFRVHLWLAGYAVLAGWVGGLSREEWLWVLLAIGIVLGAELGNSAVERVVDLVTAEVHPLAKAAKDLSAAAVLLAASFALAVGVFVLLPPFAARAVELRDHVPTGALVLGSLVASGLALGLVLGRRARDRLPSAGRRPSAAASLSLLPGDFLALGADVFFALLYWRASFFLLPVVACVLPPLAYVFAFSGPRRPLHVFLWFAVWLGMGALGRM
ncbi:MAG: Diacylglycerol kinase [Brockia lithotrophica]|uniref:Diacylglycerol kinase n=1 Tax=Brockia lithotrophica TaxID=933949 RepID=A0A2T5G713_9BACL|nr:MAG: Diacylglycerol kinase [Brockia lithotrophica]